MDTTIRTPEERIRHIAATKATKPIDDYSDDEDNSHDEEVEDEDDEALEAYNMDYIALKLLELLHPELRCIEKKQNQ